MADREQTLSTINKRMEQLGDLPIFSASVNRVRKVSTDPDSTALALSEEIGKDANLTAKILRLANSSYYNRGKGKIGVMSRAVVVLGFNTIKNICLTLKLIDSFQHEHPSIDMNKMLVNSYLAAGFVREIAVRCGVKDVEETYTCALLHNLGEISVAYFLPEKFLVMKKMEQAGEHTRAEVEQTVLGMSSKEIGQHLATSWEFPSNVVKTMDRYDPEVDPVGLSAAKLNRALASLGNTVVESLQGFSSSKRKLNEIMGEVAEVAGLDHSLVQHGLVDSFKMSCELAGEYGLKRSLLMPPGEESGDEFRDRMAGKLSYFASSYRPSAAGGEDDAEVIDMAEGGANPDTPASEPAAAGAPPAARADGPDDPPVAAQSGAGPAAPAADATRPAPVAAKQADAQAQLAIVHEITALLATTATLNDVFIKALEGVTRGAAFERAVLILLNRGRNAYSARVASGVETQALREFFQLPVEPEGDLFSRVLMEGNELLVSDSSDPSWATALPPGFLEQVRAPAFMIGALRHGPNPIGLFYADNAVSGAEINDEQQRGFMQFLAQARLAIQLSNSAAG